MKTCKRCGSAGCDAREGNPYSQLYCNRRALRRERASHRKTGRALGDVARQRDTWRALAEAAAENVGHESDCPTGFTGEYAACTCGLTQWFDQLQNAQHETNQAAAQAVREVLGVAVPAGSN